MAMSIESKLASAEKSLEAAKAIVALYAAKPNANEFKEYKNACTRVKACETRIKNLKNQLAAEGFLATVEAAEPEVKAVATKATKAKTTPMAALTALAAEVDAIEPAQPKAVNLPQVKSKTVRKPRKSAKKAVKSTSTVSTQPLLLLPYKPMNDAKQIFNFFKQIEAKFQAEIQANYSALAEAEERTLVLDEESKITTEEILAMDLDKLVVDHTPAEAAAPEAEAKETPIERRAAVTKSTWTNPKVRAARLQRHSFQLDALNGKTLDSGVKSHEASLGYEAAMKFLNNLAVNTLGGKVVYGSLASKVMNAAKDVDVTKSISPRRGRFVKGLVDVEYFTVVDAEGKEHYFALTLKAE